MRDILEEKTLMKHQLKSVQDRIYDVCVHIQIYIYTQVVSNTHYQINSSAGQEIYDVHITAQECSQKPKCIPQCTEPNCEYLCRHLITCTCIDYVLGHLCKHSHKVCKIIDIRTALP